MMYPFMTLNDDTEITHSEMKADGKVKVYIEDFTMPHAGFLIISGRILRDILIQRWHILNS